MITTQWERLVADAPADGEDERTATIGAGDVFVRTRNHNPQGKRPKYIQVRSRHAGYVQVWKWSHNFGWSGPLINVEIDALRAYRLATAEESRRLAKKGEAPRTAWERLEADDGVAS